MSLMLDVCNKIEELANRDLSDYFNHIGKRAITSKYITLASSEYPSLDIINQGGAFVNESLTKAMKWINIDVWIATQIFDKENDCMFGQYDSDGNLTKDGLLQLVDYFENMLNDYPLLEDVVHKRDVDTTNFEDGTFEENDKAGFFAARRYSLQYGKIETFIKQKGRKT